MNEARFTKQLIKARDKYFCWVVRPATVQRISVLTKAWYRQFGTSTVNFYTHAGDTGYFFEKSKYEKLGQDLRRRFHSEKFIRRHLANYRKYCRQLLLTGKRALTVRADKRNLLRLLYQYEKSLGNYAFYFITTFSVDDYVFPEFRKILKKTYSDDVANKFTDIIATPTIVFGYQMYQRDLLKARNASDYARLVRRYRWVKEYSFQEKLLDVTTARKEKHDLLSAGAHNKILKTTSNCRRSRTRFNALLRRIKNPHLRLQAKLVNDYVNIKTDRIEIYKRFQTDFRAFFHKLLKLVKEDLPSARYEHMISLTDEEIIEYLQHGRLPDLRAAMKRYLYKYVAGSFRGKTFFIYNPLRIRMIRSAFLKTGMKNEIHGHIISFGKARGRVRIIKSTNDLQTLRAGQILVANFTTPEYVPAIKRAAAIITDDGGITSHAAIISRELGKPCVTGTKIATQVLKDGDRVEVDATKGIVKKI